MRTKRCSAGGAAIAAATGLGLGRQSAQIEVTEPLGQHVGRSPCALGGNTLREQDADQERLGAALHECVRFGQIGEGVARLRGACRCELVAEVAQRPRDIRAAEGHQRRGPFVRKKTHRVQVSLAAALKSISGLKTSIGSPVT